MCNVWTSHFVHSVKRKNVIQNECARLTATDKTILKWLIPVDMSVSFNGHKHDCIPILYILIQYGIRNGQMQQFLEQHLDFFSLPLCVSVVYFFSSFFHTFENIARILKYTVISGFFWVILTKKKANHPMTNGEKKVNFIFQKIFKQIYAWRKERKKEKSTSICVCPMSIYGNILMFWCKTSPAITISITYSNALLFHVIYVCLSVPTNFSFD